MCAWRSADRGDRQGMSVGDRPLWQLTAGELVEGYAAGLFTPVDALDAVLERHDAVNPSLNAVVTLAVEQARAAAEASTQRWRNGTPASGLDGVPMTVKDNLFVAGMRATWGSRAFSDFVPDHDERPVARLRAAGLVIFGKTNVPELTVQGYTDNLLFGPSGNPANPALTPGGSSGGAAAAVGSGIGPLALCTDGGGSIRRPASHCGLFGLKPSSGTIRRGQGFPAILGEFEVVGPIARSLDDIALMLDVLADGVLPEARTEDAPRILHARTFNGQPVDPEIAAGIDRAAESLRSRGCAIETRDSFDCLSPMDAIWPVISTSGVAFMFEQNPALAEQAGPALKAMAKTGRGFAATDYARAIVGIEKLKDTYREAMAGFDVLMTPAIAALSWAKETSHPETIDGQPVGPRGHAIFTAFANALGLPGLSVPAGTSADGRPFGFQLVGARGSEKTLIDLARRFAVD